MIRCNVCGRSLVGLRADHPVHCRIETDLRSSRVELVGAPIPDRVLVASPEYAAMIMGAAEAARYDEAGRNPRTILEGDSLDPLASDEERTLVIDEGPVQRGARKNGTRLRFAS